MVVQKADKKGDFELPESQKYKLTLGIDREVVRRAKMQDVNISFWTEQLLKIMTFKREEITTSHENVVQTWFTFLSEVSRILKKYELTSIEIGHLEMEYGRGRLGATPESNKELGWMSGYRRLTLNQAGRTFEETFDINGKVIFEKDLMEEIRKEYEDEPVVIRAEGVVLSKELIYDYLSREFLLPPTQIIENLIKEMTQSSKVNKEKIREMNIALRILRMIAENGNNNVGKREVENKT